MLPPLRDVQPVYLQRSIRTAFSVAVALLIALVGVLVGFGVGAGPAAATTAEAEQVFVQLINQLRTDNGLDPLTVDTELRTAARSWTSSMASNDSLAHSPDMTAGITAPWTVLGENVGVHGVHDLQQLFQAFVDSPSHYRNLTDARFQYVGVGVVHAPNGKIWTTHKFMAASQPASTPTTSPAPTPTTTPTLPPTTATPTTQPPTTAVPPTAVPATAVPTTAVPATAPASVPKTNSPTTAADSTPAPTLGDTATPNTTPIPTPTPAWPSPSAPASQPISPDRGTGNADGTYNSSDATGVSSDGVALDRSTSTDGFDPLPTSSEEMAELVKPDAETIETVLIDLMLAGI